MAMDPTRETARWIFRVGAKVEVSFEEDNLHNVWFPATVVEDLGNNLCLVEYECSGANDEAELRSVTVDHSNIRLSIPQPSDRNFGLLEKVDAFYDFGWWSGVITKKLADSRYAVYFKSTNKVRELGHRELRPHVEWKGDKWFPRYQVPVSNVDSVKGGELSAVKCNTEQRTTDLIEDTTFGIDKQTTLMKETKLTSLGSNDKHVNSYKKLKAGTTSDAGQSKEESNPPVGHNTQESSTGDKTFGDISGGKKMTGKRGKSVELNRPKKKPARKKGRLSADIEGHEALPRGDSTKTTVEKEHATKDLRIPVVLGLQCNVMTLLPRKKQKRLASEAKTPQSCAPLVPKTTGNLEGKESDAGTIPKRKRGRPPKLQAKSPETSLAVTHQNGDAVPGAGTETGSDNLVHEKEQLQVAGSRNAPKQKKTSELSMDTAVFNVDKPPNTSSGKALTVEQDKYKQRVKGKLGKRNVINSINNESSTPDCQEPSKQKASNGGLEKDSTAESLDTMSDDQPLSRWFEGMQSVATVDSTVEYPLSFEKRSSLWQTLESMEPFRMVAQKPHFGPLKSMKESLREGQAISKMVTFVRVVEGTSQARSNTPRSTIKEYMEVVVDLESHGFDVEMIRNRLTELLLVKDEQEGLEARAIEVGDKLEGEKAQGERMKREIELIDEQVQVLVRERKQMLRNKEEKESEVDSLETEVKAIKEGLVELQLKFDGIAASSLLRQQD